MLKNNSCLLLTGTIAPGNVPNLVRNSHIDRENDYYIAIKRWLSLGYVLVFVENSNYKSERIERLFNEYPNCEYLKFNGERSYLGKGNGEAEIIEYAFNESSILNNYKLIVKITGRLFISNLSKLINSTLKETSIYVVANFYNNLEFADSRLIIADKGFYTNYLIKETSRIDESKHIYFEHVFAMAIHRAMADGFRWRLPIETPIFVGYSATGGIEYKHNFIRIFKRNSILKTLQFLFNIKP